MYYGLWFLAQYSGQNAYLNWLIIQLTKILSNSLANSWHYHNNYPVKDVTDWLLYLTDAL
jgi:hypothetical protein